MKHVLSVVVIGLLTTVAQPSLNASPGHAAGDVKITVHYTGKGKVDASHKIWVWLFDSPNIGAGSMPIEQLALDKNDTDAVFGGVTAGEVWVAVAFDEQGAMQGDAPPPTGTPIGILMQDGKPLGISPGEKGSATLTFNDMMRMP